MKTAVLFSGGKDSCLALHYAMKSTEVKCLITIISENPASYMFHTPNILLAKKQAEAIGIPIILERTKGEKEKELEDLERAVKKAKEKYNIEGIVTGALASVYQASRARNLCKKLGLKCINPLWQRDQLGILKEIVALNFEAVVVGVFALGMEKFIGRKIDEQFITDIQKVHAKYRVNLAGEGGEFESFVTDAPFFKKKLVIEKSHIESDNAGGKVLVIDSIKLAGK